MAVTGMVVAVIGITTVVGTGIHEHFYSPPKSPELTKLLSLEEELDKSVYLDMSLTYRDFLERPFRTYENKARKLNSQIDSLDAAVTGIDKERKQYETLEAHKYRNRDRSYLVGALLGLSGTMVALMSLAQIK